MLSRAVIMDEIIRLDVSPSTGAHPRLSLTVFTGHARQHPPMSSSVNLHMWTFLQI